MRYIKQTTLWTTVFRCHNNSDTRVQSGHSFSFPKLVSCLICSAGDEIFSRMISWIISINLFCRELKRWCRNFTWRTESFLSGFLIRSYYFDVGVVLSHTECDSNYGILSMAIQVFSDRQVIFRIVDWILYLVYYVHGISCSSLLCV